MPGLNGWHPGENIIHEKLGITGRVASFYTKIQGELPVEHAQFFETCLPFLPITTLDESGRPWGSILAGKDGEKGFIRSREPTRLEVKAQTWDGDPLGDNLRMFNKVENLMVAGIGIQFETRRRNKFAGVISKIHQSGHDIEMELLVKEAMGNCPKYINVRDFEPVVQRNPTVIYDQRSLSIDDRLPDSMIDFILSSDTAFIGSSYITSPEYREKYPSHLGINQRGGLPGFVRVRKDGRTLVLPDFSGNRLMTTLGNIEATPLASMTLVDFDSGDILYITGSAKNVMGSPAHRIMPFQKRLTLIRTTAYIFVRDALPVRQKRAEESSTTLFSNDGRPEAKLSQIRSHDPHIATFTWTTSKDLHIIPGQAIILDCSQFLGTEQYRHLAPTSDNDDCIRTWTVSSSSSEPSRTFSITLRHKPGGILTSVLFSIVQKVTLEQPGLLLDTTSLNVTTTITGIFGDFTLPKSLFSLTEPVERELVWFAGGVGLTPFLSMLSFLQANRKEESVAIRFILSTREPNVLPPLIFNVYTGVEPSYTTSKILISLDVFHSGLDAVKDFTVPIGIILHLHARRLDGDYIKGMREDFKKGEQVYVCGPEVYTEMVVGGLVEVGICADGIRTEVFNY